MEALLEISLFSGYGNAFTVTFFVMLILTTIIIGIIFAVKGYRTKSSPDTNKAIEATQIRDLETKLLGFSQSKKGITSAFTTVPKDEQILMNANVLSTRLVGYLGPYDSGVFSEDAAVRLALSTGARCLVLEIDYMNSNPSQPVLVYRDARGIKLSNTVGNINKVARSIAARAFQTANDSVPPNVANDPLIVVLYFARIPPVALIQTANVAKESLLFLAQVARELAPIRNLLVGQTVYGDFRRHAQENKIFFLPTDTFNKRIILMTNADTSLFRKRDLLGLAGTITTDNDLDFMTHVRLYSAQSASGLGATSVPPSSVKPSAIITTPAYWLNTPNDRKASAITQTKSAWTLVMNPAAEASNTVTKENLNTLLQVYGVHSVPFCIFDKTDAWIDKGGLYEKSAWLAKGATLRYTPPKPIVVVKASPSTNTKGGIITVPSISTTKPVTTVAKPLVSFPKPVMIGPKPATTAAKPATTAPKPATKPTTVKK